MPILDWLKNILPTPEARSVPAVGVSDYLNFKSLYGREPRQGELQTEDIAPLSYLAGQISGSNIAGGIPGPRFGLALEGTRVDRFRAALAAAKKAREANAVPAITEGASVLPGATESFGSLARAIRRQKPLAVQPKWETDMSLRDLMKSDAAKKPSDFISTEGLENYPELKQYYKEFNEWLGPEGFEGWFKRRELQKQIKANRARLRRESFRGEE